MQNKSQQLVLGLPHREALGRDDFLVASSNSAAVELVDQWPNWPSYAAIIIGPEGSGKTHLLEVWRQRSGAKIFDASALSVDTIPEMFAGGAAAIDNLQVETVDERALFHGLNMAKQEKVSLLLTSRLPVSELHFNIPDLRSRLNALPTIQILPPDDALLRGVLVKLFADRQITINEGIVSYILLRMPRSLGAARNLVSEIDKLAFIEKAEMTKALIARVLVKIVEPDLFTMPDKSFT